MAKKKKKAKARKERKPTKLEELIRNNPSKTLVVLMVVLLVMRIGVFMSQASPSPSPPVSPGVFTINPALNPNDPNNVLVQVRQMLGQKETFEESKYWPLVSAGMFDAKQVRKDAGNEREATRYYNEAAQAFERYRRTGSRADLLDAYELVATHTLQLQPFHLYGRQLRDQIEAELERMESGAGVAGEQEAAPETPPELPGEEEF
jgi:hypothetical protein